LKEEKEEDEDCDKNEEGMELVGDGGRMWR